MFINEQCSVCIFSIHWVRACSQRQKVSSKSVQLWVFLAAAYLLMLSVNRNLSKQWGSISKVSSFSIFNIFSIFNFLKKDLLVLHFSFLVSIHFCLSVSPKSPYSLSSFFWVPKTWVSFSCWKTARSLSESSFFLLNISTDTAVHTKWTHTSFRR